MAKLGLLHDSIIVNKSKSDLIKTFHRLANLDLNI